MMSNVYSNHLKNLIENGDVSEDILDKSVYAITKDTSTTISFDLEYLKTLSIGKHTATINYVDNNTMLAT